ncbi:MAG: hypothetical protein GX087_03380 [Desulfobulbaceae bacterium]|nr:hypothetical protein [Desulfobulbaceae bacterium]
MSGVGLQLCTGEHGRNESDSPKDSRYSAGKSHYERGGRKGHRSADKHDDD